MTASLNLRTFLVCLGASCAGAFGAVITTSVMTEVLLILIATQTSYFEVGATHPLAPVVGMLQLVRDAGTFTSGALAFVVTWNIVKLRRSGTLALSILLLVPIGFLCDWMDLFDSEMVERFEVLR